MQAYRRPAVQRALVEQRISFDADRLIEMLEARGLWSEQTS